MRTDRLPSAGCIIRRSFACSAAIAASLLAAMPVAAAPRVAGIAAYLLDSKTGKLSGDLLQTPELLGNAVTVGRSALVVVKITYGKTDAMPAGQRLRLVATEGARAAAAGGNARAKKRILIDRTVKLGPIGEDGSTNAGFWLDDVGCAPVLLDASLLTAGTARKHVELGFQCYE